MCLKICVASAWCGRGTIFGPGGGGGGGAPGGASVVTRNARPKVCGEISGASSAQPISSACPESCPPAEETSVIATRPNEPGTSSQKAGRKVTAAGHRGIVAGALAFELASPSTLRPLDLVTPKPVREDATLDLGDRKVQAAIYRPARGRHGAVVFSMGVKAWPLGDPRLDRRLVPN